MPSADQSPTVHPLLDAAFHALDDADIVWALMRGADDLAAPAGDVDLVIAPGRIADVDAALATAGFVRIGALGYGSHRFWFGMDPDSSLTIKIDVVSDVAFGSFQHLHLPVLDDVLARREQRDGIWRLAAADEAWLFLLHQVLDKGRIRASHVADTRKALQVVTPADAVGAALDRLCGPGTAARLTTVVTAGDDAGVRRLSHQLQRRWATRRPVTTVGRYGANRVLRRFVEQGRRLRPGIAVAVVGPDGAGKTTVLDGLSTRLPTATRSVYMGLWSRSRMTDTFQRIPGGQIAEKLGRAIRSSLAIRYHRARGRVVLVDRFVYDAVLPGDRDTSLGGRIIAFCSVRCAPAPDVMLVMDAPGSVMFARKGEHTVEILEQRRQAYAKLAAIVPGSALLDATAPAAEVLDNATSAIWTRYVSTTAHRTAPDHKALRELSRS